jgi:hypothetical protein
VKEAKGDVQHQIPKHATLLISDMTQLVLDATWDKKLLHVVFLVTAIPSLSCIWSKL